jgi:hypothetical protein
MRNAVMSHEHVCSWLGLPPDSWPPDHYTLLGLAPGEADLDRIEQCVHERLLLLRARQLNHPEQASEALNLLARAFSCLTDPEAKRSYDAALLDPPAGKESPPPEAGTALPAVWPGMNAPVLPPAWVGPAVGVVASWTTGWFQEPSSPSTEANAPQPNPIFHLVDLQARPPAAPPPSANGAPPAAPAPLPPARPVDSLVVSARSSSARRGLGTKRALYHRIACTRRLLAAWERAGTYLGQARRRLVRSGEAAELTRQLRAIGHYLEQFPPLLGEAGQPGFYVVSLIRQEMVVPTFRMLLPSQRATLARDWRDGRKLLAAHLEFLRQELRALRKAGWARRWLRAVDTFFSDHPALLLLAVTLLAVGVTLAITFWR